MNIIVFSLLVSFAIVYVLWASKLIWKAFNDSKVSSEANLFVSVLLFVIGWVFGIVVGPILILIQCGQNIGGKK